MFLMAHNKVNCINTWERGKKIVITHGRIILKFSVKTVQSLSNSIKTIDKTLGLRLGRMCYIFDKWRDAPNEEMRFSNGDSSQIHILRELAEWCCCNSLMLLRDSTFVDDDDNVIPVWQPNFVTIQKLQGYLPLHCQINERRKSCPFGIIFSR